MDVPGGSRACRRFERRAAVAAIERLASAHMELIKKGGYKFSDGDSAPPFFEINPWKAHEGAILSTRRVLYNWVFHEKVLADSKAWTTSLLTDTGKIGDWDDNYTSSQRIGVYRRILHAMWPQITDDRLKTRQPQIGFEEKRPSLFKD